MVEGCGCQMNTIYSTGKGCEANKSHWLITDIAKLYGRTVIDTGGRLLVFYCVQSLTCSSKTECGSDLEQSSIESEDDSLSIGARTMCWDCS